jgi:RNA polymerase sigma-70 factor (ECF subfamily)
MRDSAREVQVSEQQETALHASASLEASQQSVDTFDYQARSGRIYRCLEQLEPARRNCILHAYVDGYSHSEISQKLGAPLGTVKAWIKRSLVALRECMG